MPRFLPSLIATLVLLVLPTTAHAATRTLPLPDGYKLSGLSSVECLSRSMCIASGGITKNDGTSWDGAIWTSTDGAGTWRVSKPLPFEAAGPMTCMAFGCASYGGFSTDPAAGAWTPIGGNDTIGMRNDDSACSAATCFVVAHQNMGMLWKLWKLDLSTGNWTAVDLPLPPPTPVPGTSLTQPPPAPHRVECSSVDVCVVTDGNSFNSHAWTSSNGGEWTLRTLPQTDEPFREALIDLSCVPTGFCVKLALWNDAPPTAAPPSTSTQTVIGWTTNDIDGGIWTRIPAPVLSMPAGTTPSIYARLSCTSSTACFLFDRTSGMSWYASNPAGGSWARVQPPAPFLLGPKQSLSVETMKCMTASWCIATGAVRRGTRSVSPVIWSTTNLAAGTWEVHSFPAPVGEGTREAGSASCVSASFCVASVGYGANALHEGLGGTIWTSTAPASGKWKVSAMDEGLPLPWSMTVTPLPRQTIASVASVGVHRHRVTFRSAGSVAESKLTLTRTIARRLGLTVPRGDVVLAVGSLRIKSRKAGPATLSIRLAPRVRIALSRTTMRSVALKLTTTFSMGNGVTPLITSTAITLRR